MVTMTNLKQNLMLCVVLFCCVQDNNSLELDDETKEKITELVGVRQNALRIYLENVKSKTDKIEYTVRKITGEAKDSLQQEVNKTIDYIKAHTAGKPEKEDCAEQINQGILEIMAHFETIHTNCLSSTRPDIPELFRDITKYAEFQSIIGVTPRNCINASTDAESVLKCIAKAIVDIGKQMEESQIHLSKKIDQIQKQLNGMENSINNCQNKEVEVINSKGNELKEQFDGCVK